MKTSWKNFLVVAIICLFICGTALLGRGLVLADTPETAKPAEDVKASAVDEVADSPTDEAAEKTEAGDADEDGDTLIITGTRKQTRENDLPAASIVIREPRLKFPDAKNILDALKRESGVNIGYRQEGGIFGADIDLRGFTTNSMSGGNLLILLDGIPQRRLSFGGPYMGALPFDAVTRMELVKGPLSMQYGRGSLAGALQLFTDPGSNIFGGNVQLTYDTASQHIRSYVRLSGPLPVLDGSTFSLTVSGGHSEGWQEMTESNQGFLYWHGNLRLGAQDDLKLIAGFYRGCEDVASPVLIDKDGDRIFGIDRDDNLAVPGQNSIYLTEYRLGGAWSHYYSDTFRHKMTLAYWYGDTKWRCGRPGDAPASGTEAYRMTDDRHFEEHGVYSEMVFQKDYTVSPNLTGTLTFGVNLEYMTLDNFYQGISTSAGAGVVLDLSTMYEIPKSEWIYGSVTRRKTREWDAGIFIGNESRLFDRLTVVLGARLDYYRRYQRNLENGNSSTIDDMAVSPAVGLSYRLLGETGGKDYLNVYANWGRGFFPVFRGGAGNAELADLEAETSESYEVGMKLSALKGRLLANMALYQITRNDITGWNAWTGQQENMGDWRVRGVECDLRAKPFDWLELYGNYTYRWPEIIRNDNTPAVEGNSPEYVSKQLFKLGAEYNYRQKFFVGADLKWAGSSYADEANTVTLPSHCEVGAHATYLWKDFSLTCFVENMFDEEYYSGVFGGVTYGSAFEGAPRTFGFSLSYRFTLAQADEE